MVIFTSCQLLFTTLIGYSKWKLNHENEMSRNWQKLTKAAVAQWHAGLINVYGSLIFESVGLL